MNPAMLEDAGGEKGGVERPERAAPEGRMVGHCVRVGWTVTVTEERVSASSEEGETLPKAEEESGESPTATESTSPSAVMVAGNVRGSGAGTAAAAGKSGGRRLGPPSEVTGKGDYGSVSMLEGAKQRAGRWRSVWSCVIGVCESTADVALEPRVPW